MIVLDTHILIWYLDGANEKLSDKALAMLKEAAGRRAVNVSCISAWEISMLVNKGRLQFRIPVDMWMVRVERLPSIHFVPIDNEIARTSVNLPGSAPNDPADRLIIATAKLLGLPLLTADERIREYSEIETIW